MQTSDKTRPRFSQLLDELDKDLTESPKQEFSVMSSSLAVPDALFFLIPHLMDAVSTSLPAVSEITRQN